MTLGLNRNCPLLLPASQRQSKALSGVSGRTCPLVAHPKAVCHFWDAPTCPETTEFPTGVFYLLSKGPLTQSSAEADTLLRTLLALCSSQVAPRTMKTSTSSCCFPSSSFLVLLPHIISTANSLWYPLPPWAWVTQQQANSSACWKPFPACSERVWPHAL